jgi:hypothetical protein
MAQTPKRHRKAALDLPHERLRGLSVLREQSQEIIDRVRENDVLPLFLVEEDYRVALIDADAIFIAGTPGGPSSTPTTSPDRPGGCHASSPSDPTDPEHRLSSRIEEVLSASSAHRSDATGFTEPFAQNIPTK